ncbi:MAG: DUF3667 domain-containing protein, partial [Kordiimonadaceae bacterium]|nr:DUF3667 domain-containing protein [Kordiimonadaceae bacterium]
MKAPELFHNFIEAITNTDFRLWHTLRDIVRNPGLVALKYIHGARLTYINPIQFFIWTFALYVGFLAAVGWFDTDIGQGMDVTIDGDKGISEDIKSYME